MELVQTSKIKPFIAKNLKELKELYAKKGVPDDLKDPDVLKNTFKNKKQTLLDLVESKPESSSEIMTSAGTSLALRLKAPTPEITALSNEFAEQLNWDNETKDNLNVLHVDLTLIQDSLKSKEFHPSMLAGRLEQISQRATAVLDEQCQKEKDKIYQIFKDKGREIGQHLGIAPPHMDAFRDKLIDRIEKNKDEQSKLLKDALEKEVDELLKNNKRAAELAGIHSMFLANKKNKKQIMRFMAKKEKAAPGIGFTLSQGGRDEIDPTITLNDFQPYTINGNKMTVNGNQITVGIPAIGLRYNFLSLDNRPFYDFTSITNYAKAQGCTRIEMFVDYPNDEEYAMALAAMEAEACFISGFYKIPDENDPSKMVMAATFKVNGETKTLEQIFANNLPRLQLLIERWEKDEKIRNSVSVALKQQIKDDKKAYKKTLAEVKADPEEMNKRSIDPIRVR